MQIPLGIMLVLSGLGCQNGASTVVDTPPLPSHYIDAQPSTSSQGTVGTNITYSSSFAPSPYPQIGNHVYDRNAWSEPTDWHTRMRYTLYSFVWGRDPNITTAREIEASVYGFPSAH
jgi:hypothetical protein